jgi:hypothetical protein
MRTPFAVRLTAPAPSWKNGRQGKLDREIDLFKKRFRDLDAWKHQFHDSAKAVRRTNRSHASEHARTSRRQNRRSDCKSSEGADDRIHVGRSDVVAREVIGMSRCAPE